MQKIRKLPETEFDVMKAAWEMDPPITANMVMERLKNSWKAPTVITLLNRLVEKNFLTTEKHGKERLYYCAINKDDYLKFETGNFVKQYHSDSIVSLVSAFYNNSDDVSVDELNDLIDWVNKQKKC